MRFLLANNHCISDPTAGVTQSPRMIMRSLREAGHDCRVLTTARFESPVTFTIEEHLLRLGVPLSDLQTAARRGHGEPQRRGTAARDVYVIDEIPVTLLLTRQNDESRPDRVESAQYHDLLVDALREFALDQLIA